MKKLITLLVVLVTTGCNVYTPSNVVEDGVAQCESNGGLESIQTHVSTPFEHTYIKFVCGNGATFTYDSGDGVSEQSTTKKVTLKRGQL